MSLHVFLRCIKKMKNKFNFFFQYLYFKINYIYIYSFKFNFMFKIQNYKYMVYILNIEEVNYVSNFKINIFYFMSKYIHHIIFKSNLCTQKYFTFSHIKDDFFIGFILDIFSI